MAGSSERKSPSRAASPPTSSAARAPAVPTAKTISGATPEPAIPEFAVIVPLHLLIFLHPLLPIFSQVLVGVGHAFQYQRIVWLYGRRKYGQDQGVVGRLLFRNAGFYFLGGLLFTILLLRGPFIERMIQRADAVLGAQVLAAFFMGWLFQHYYLDAKIWRVANDTGVQKNLGV